MFWKKKVKTVEEYLAEAKRMKTSEEELNVIREGISVHKKNFKLIEAFASFAGENLTHKDSQKGIVNAYKSAYSVFPNEPKFIFKLAYYLEELDNNNIEEVIKLYEKCIAITDGKYKSSSYNNLGTIYLNLGENEKAIENFMKANQFNTNWDLPLKNLLLTYKRHAVKNTNKIIETYEKLININDGDKKTYLFDLANLYYEVKENDKAICYANMALEIVYECTTTHLLLVKIYVSKIHKIFNKRELEKAKSLLEMLDFHFLNAKRFVNGELEIRLLDKYESLISKLKNGWVGNKIALEIFYSQEFSSETRSYLKILRNNNTEALEFIANADKELAIGNYSSAMQFYRKAIPQLFISDAKIFYNIGECCMALNQLSEAETYYKKAIELNPEYAEAYNSYTKLLMQQSRFEEAEINYELAKKYWKEES